MNKAEIKDVASSDLAKYDFLVERIAELEEAQVETRLRPEESKLRGLQQTLASYEGTLLELHEVYEYRHKLTHKAEGSFDLLGKKHKQRKVDEQREKEQQACRAERAQRERVENLIAKIQAQREVVLDLRKKTRELDAVRQAELDFVDRLFHADEMILDPQHDALEDAVCSLAPRQFKMREALATRAVVQSKLESALHQLKSAAEELEHAYEPSHRIIKDKFGDELGEEFFDSADEAAKLSAVQTADRLAKAAVHNLAKARQRMAVLPGLNPEESSGLACCIEPVLRQGANLNSASSRKLIRNSINLLYVAGSQTQFASQCVGDESRKIEQDLHHLESLLASSKSQLDMHRRSLLSQVQEAKRSNSLRLSEDGSYSGTLTSLKSKVQERWAKRSGQGMGDKVPSVNSGLAKLG